MKIVRTFFIIETLILSLLFVGCDSISKNVQTFDELFNSNDYNGALVVYNENKENEIFIEAVNSTANNTIQNIKDDFNNETYNLDEAKTNIENIKEFISDDIYKQTIKNLDDLYVSKNNFNIAQEKEELLDFELALMYYKKVSEDDVNYTKAKENINILNEKIRESYRQVVISIKDKVTVAVDDIENGYSIDYEIVDQKDILMKEPYVGVLSVGITGKTDKNNSAMCGILFAQLVPQLTGNFKEVIFYQESNENVTFEEKDMPVQGDTYVGWINMYGENELASVLFNNIVSEYNTNNEKFVTIYNMLKNDKEEIIIRMYSSGGLSIDYTLKDNERQKMIDMFRLYNALKFDNELINELI